MKRERERERIEERKQTKFVGEKKHAEGDEQWGEREKKGEGKKKKKKINTRKKKRI